MLNLPKIIVAGNSTCDLIFKGKSLDERREKRRLSLAFGGKYNVDTFFQSYGGGGNNAATCLARQGLSVHLWSLIGNDVFGHEIRGRARKEGINASLILQKNIRTPISAILLTEYGERTIITYRGEADELKISPEVLTIMKKMNWLLFYGLPQMKKLDKLRILKHAKAMGLKTMLSLHGSEYRMGYSYLKDYLRLTDIIHLNVYELADLINKDLKDINLHKTNFSHILKVPFVLATHDIHGSYCYTQNNIYYQITIPEKKRVDTTGAGDAYSASFLGKYLKTNDFKKAMYFAALNATAKVEKLGAQTGLLYDK